MSLHSQFLEKKRLLDIEESGLNTGIQDGISMSVTNEGMRIETRSPGGSGDVVHTLYLKTKQIYLLKDYIEKVFID